MSTPPSTRRLMLAVSVFLLAAATAVGQNLPNFPHASSDSTRLYTYIEQMPQLPSGGGGAAVVAAIRERVAPGVGTCSGKVFLSFVVGPSGVAKDARIVKGLGPGCDEAVLAAVAKLPRFRPGRQSGRAVSVLFTLPIPF